jgi:carbamoyltransferase
VLNTSFNLKGEPIVCTPEDALRTFFSCGLDALIIGSFEVRKKK